MEREAKIHCLLWQYFLLSSLSFLTLYRQFHWAPWGDPRNLMAQVYCYYFLVVGQSSYSQCTLIVCLKLSVIFPFFHRLKKAHRRTNVTRKTARPECLENPDKSMRCSLALSVLIFERKFFHTCASVHFWTEPPIGSDRSRKWLWLALRPKPKQPSLAAVNLCSTVCPVVWGDLLDTSFCLQWNSSNIGVFVRVCSLLAKVCTAFQNGLLFHYKNPASSPDGPPPCTSHKRTNRTGATGAPRRALLTADGFKNLTSMLEPKKPFWLHKGKFW